MSAPNLHGFSDPGKIWQASDTQAKPVEAERTQKHSGIHKLLPNAVTKRINSMASWVENRPAFGMYKQHKGQLTTLDKTNNPYKLNEYTKQKQELSTLKAENKVTMDLAIQNKHVNNEDRSRVMGDKILDKALDLVDNFSNNRFRSVEFGDKQIHLDRPFTSAPNEVLSDLTQAKNDCTNLKESCKGNPALLQKAADVELKCEKKILEAKQNTLNLYTSYLKLDPSGLKDPKDIAQARKSFEAIKKSGIELNLMHPNSKLFSDFDKKLKVAEQNLPKQ